MEGIINGVNYRTFEESEIGGNVHSRYPESNEIRKTIHSKLEIMDALEPDYYAGGQIIYVTDQHAADMINYKFPTCVKCNGIITNKNFMKENKMGVYGRSSDCLMLAIIGKNDYVAMLHISAESLNNGIFLSLPPFMDGSVAILGPCICGYHYSLNKEVALQRVQNYETLGYRDLCALDEEGKLHIDIKQISKFELEKRHIQVLKSDDRCTFECSELGSHRRGDDPPRANPLYLWI